MSKDWRPVIDHFPLSLHAMLIKETVALVPASNRRGDAIFLIDFKDAYFEIPVHWDQDHTSGLLCNHLLVECLLL